MDTVTKWWEKRMEQEDKSMHDKYETINTAVQRLRLDMVYMTEKERAVRQSTATAFTGSEGSLRSGQAGFLPNLLEL